MLFRLALLASRAGAESKDLLFARSIQTFRVQQPLNRAETAERFAPSKLKT
jgi:hypothetical protein